MRHNFAEETNNVCANSDACIVTYFKNKIIYLAAHETTAKQSPALGQPLWDHISTDCVI